MQRQVGSAYPRIRRNYPRKLDGGETHAKELRCRRLTGCPAVHAFEINEAPSAMPACVRLKRRYGRSSGQMVRELTVAYWPIPEVHPPVHG
jgi:hypothetical protein